MSQKEMRLIPECQRGPQNKSWQGGYAFQLKPFIVLRFNGLPKQVKVNERLAETIYRTAASLYRRFRLKLGPS